MIHDCCLDDNVEKLIAVLQELKENDTLDRFIDQRDDKKYSPLHVAIFARNLGAVSALMMYGADTNLKCHGTPPLLLALRTASQPNSREFGISCFMELLKCGNTVLNRKDDEGYTAIHLAARYNMVEVIEEIVTYPEALPLLSTAIKGNGLTPAHVAAYYDSFEAIRCLYKHGVSLKAKLSLCGSTPLHVAATRRSLAVYQWLSTLPQIQDTPDKFGHTAADLLPPVSQAAVSPIPRTAIVSSEVCFEHHTCPPSELESSPPPENVHRLHVLIDVDDGILHSSQLNDHVQWHMDCTKAEVADILRVHEWSYVKKVKALCEGLTPDPEETEGMHNLDGDTAISRYTYDAALSAAGSVCVAVDKVLAKEVTNAFCPVRPPGHHAGPVGIVPSKTGSQSHGFCIFNNVSVGAAYAMNRYRDTIKKVVIVDFDVHHGNGTEETVRWLKPTIHTVTQDNTFGSSTLSFNAYKPWVGEKDPDNVLFISVHGYGPSSKKYAAYFPRSAFYPGTGATTVNDATSVNGDGEDNILDIGVGLPDDDVFSMGEDDTMAGRLISETSYRFRWRNYFRDILFPRITNFQPDMIFISAGFDAHKKDGINAGYIALIEEDYAWVTNKLVSIAHTYCDGRIVSVLEGGYQLGGEYTSAFAKSVYAHVEALVHGNTSAGIPKFTNEEIALEKIGEDDIMDELEELRQKELQKREMKLEQEQLFLQQQLQQQEQSNDMVTSIAVVEEEEEQNGRKRKRSAVDYAALAKQLAAESGAN